MFTYINENFLHAPSTDLSRDTVKTLISVNLAQAQEVFLEKQVADEKKVALLAKLASQAATLYTQAVEGVQDNVNKAIFERVWLLMVQVSELSSGYCRMVRSCANHRRSKQASSDPSRSITRRFMIWRPTSMARR